MSVRLCLLAPYDTQTLRVQPRSQRCELGLAAACLQRLSRAIVKHLAPEGAPKHGGQLVVRVAWQWVVEAVAGHGGQHRRCDGRVTRDNSNPAHHGVALHEAAGAPVQSEGAVALAGDAEGGVSRATLQNDKKMIAISPGHAGYVAAVCVAADAYFNLVSDGHGQPHWTELVLQVPQRGDCSASALVEDLDVLAQERAGF